LWFLLNAPKGKATRDELMDRVWLNNVPSLGCVRKAILDLNVALKRLNYDYFVQSDKKGNYRLTPVTW
jgi:DNA-binding winged helix-turn-helix (wHTH) protein